MRHRPYTDSFWRDFIRDMGPWIWRLWALGAVALGVIFALDVIGALARLGIYSGFLGIALGLCCVVGSGFWLSRTDGYR